MNGFQQQQHLELYRAAALHITPSREGLKSCKYVPICIFCGHLHFTQDYLRTNKLSLGKR